MEHSVLRKAGAVLAVAALGGIGTSVCGEEAPAPPVQPLPLPEVRRMVRMMNDIYITGVLTTHRMYVLEPGNPAAVTWAKQVVRQVRARGWPDARIFEATGRPLNPENAPKDDFERAAVSAFRDGKASVERIDGARYRFATPIRITDKSCLMCHVRNHEGDLLGGISYTAALVTTLKTRR